jgi:hypothetical protein
MYPYHTYFSVMYTVKYFQRTRGNCTLCVRGMLLRQHVTLVSHAWDAHFWRVCRACVVHSCIADVAHFKRVGSARDHGLLLVSTVYRQEHKSIEPRGESRCHMNSEQPVIISIIQILIPITGILLSNLLPLNHKLIESQWTYISCSNWIYHRGNLCYNTLYIIWIVNYM